MTSFIVYRDIPFFGAVGLVVVIVYIHTYVYIVQRVSYFWTNFSRNWTIYETQVIIVTAGFMFRGAAWV